ncbi:apotyrosinase chaperone MelC1 [Streptomyces tauricus]|uniref:apotyrosinase chaperone MelC1 n=1 Tax=Streptomyces tauricus TaxID=68274 RepID=UPI0022440037|nr:tyrosinase cofactor [Streptomyces tauricus]MCW8096415.1 tyrosinase cofactor [Streptomyces tauricus]
MPHPTRRRALRDATGLVVAASTLAVAAPSPGSAADRQDGPAPFDEVYKGRRIEGRPTGGHHHHGAGYTVLVDGVELHVMRNADGTWISVVSHYDPVPSPRAAARAAVEELRGARLVPFN